MRKLVLLILCLPGCRRDGAQPVFFDNSKVNGAAQCAAIDALNVRGSTVDDVVTDGNSNILVLYGSERELVTYDGRFQPLRTISFERDGPRGVRAPVSAATDGMRFYIADEKQLAVKVLDAQGGDQGIYRLDFIPRRVRVAGKSVLLTPFVAGNHPRSLLYELNSGTARSLAIPAAHYEDGGINAFANMSSLATFPDGRAVVMHETIVPFGYSLSLATRTSLPRRFAIPLPARLRAQLGRLPATPLTQQSLSDMLTVALTATADPGSGHVYYLTRSGRRFGGSWEKLIVELDASSGFVRAVVLPGIRALHMTWAPARRSLLLVDAASRWYECKL